MNSRHPDPRRVWKGGPEQRVMTPLPGIPADPGACSQKLVLEQHSSPGAAAGAAGDEFREASFGATLLHFCSLLLSAPPPPGAAAGAAAAEFREASFGATLHHFCLLLLSAPHLGLLLVLPLLNSDVLFCTQESQNSRNCMSYISDVLFCAQESHNS